MMKHTNETKETHNTTEYFNDQYFDEEVGIRGVSQRRSRARNPDTNAAQKIANTNRDASPEESEAWKSVSLVVQHDRSHTPV